MVIKESIHQLVDELPEEELSTALRFLQYLKDVGGEDPPVQTVIHGLDDLGEFGYDYDDESLGEEDEGLSVADAWRQYLNNNKTRP